MFFSKSLPSLLIIWIGRMYFRYYSIPFTADFPNLFLVFFDSISRDFQYFFPIFQSIFPNFFVLFFQKPCDIYDTGLLTFDSVTFSYQISYSSHYALTQPPPKMSDDDSDNNDSDINHDYNDGYEHGYNHGFYDGYYSDANGPDDEQSSEYSESDDSSGSESEFESESESEAESVPGSSESEAESETESDSKYKYKYLYKYKCSKCVNDSGSDTNDPGSDDPGYEEISRPVLSRPNQWKTPQSPNFSFSAFPDKNFYPADHPPP